MISFVDENGRPKTYVIVDAKTETIIASLSWAGMAVREKQRLQSQFENQLDMHNLTHQKCPAWVVSQVKADKAYCNAYALENDKRKASLLEEAKALLTEADEQGRRAAEWRTLAERG